MFYFGNRLVIHLKIIMLNVALWICQIFLAIVFVYSGAMKSTRSAENLVAMGQTGVENLPPGLIRFTGILEIPGVVGIILPRLVGIFPVLTPAAAICFGIIMILAACRAFSTKRKDNSLAEFDYFARLRFCRIRQIRFFELINKRRMRLAPEIVDWSVCFVEKRLLKRLRSLYKIQ